jgi:RNA polymerase sigma-70 factor (ECF subfamily)
MGCDNMPGDAYYGVMNKDALLALIRRVRGGERDAYAGIVAAHQDMLLAYAGYRLPDLADEVVQQTFIRAFEQLGAFRPDGDFGTWLRSVCKYMILAEVKRRQRDEHNRGNAREVLRTLILSAACREGAGEDDRWRRLHECLNKLSSPQRDLLNRRYRQSESIGELALRYQRTVTWVTTVLFRVRGLVRKCMERQAKLEVVS